MPIHSFIILSTLLLSPVLASHPTHHNNHGALKKRAFGSWANGGSTLVQAGTSGVGAMQVAVVTDDQIMILDRAEKNPLLILGHQSWGAIYTISTQALRPLNLQTNSFCAGGGWLGNGSMLSVGGNAVQKPYNAGASGLQSIRIFTPCAVGQTCDIYENPARLHLTANRWYPSTTRLTDGSVLIWGGSHSGGFNNNAGKDNPTLEFWPPKGTGQAIYSKFLHDALNTNLFPVTFALPDGTIFVAANRLAMIYNWQTNTETRLPGIPNGVRASFLRSSLQSLRSTNYSNAFQINYPSTAAAVMLPLTIANSYTPEILFCGGTTANTDGAATVLSSQIPASAQCIRMVLNAKGIAGGWIVEQMPEARVMPDGILTPDGKVVIVNGAGTGVAGYGNVPDQVGQSNAANPVYHADVYDPLGAPGQRFLTNLPTSQIERLYHSSATLLPDGRIFITGSNPNTDVTTVTYATRYQVEILSPPYVFLNRPRINAVPSNILYGQQYTIGTHFYTGTKVVTAVLMDLGFSTHGVHMSMRSVELAVQRVPNSVVITAPINSAMYPPGYGWLYILADGVPSKGLRVMVGPGDNPPESASALSTETGF